MEEKKFIDLHIHTNYSDGHFSPNEIVLLANENRTNMISISDHDSIDGLSELKETLKKDMIAVNGVEFSSFLLLNNEMIKLHILGYGFDESQPEVLSLFQEMKLKRINAHIKLLKLMKKELGNLSEESFNNLNIEKYCWFDREIIRCMETENYPVDLIRKYKQYFRKNRFSYGKDYELDSNKVISTIKKSGGYVVLAHPMAYGFDKNKIERFVRQLSNDGIDGIECFQSDCSIEDSKFLISLSQKYNLLTSVGSDFHRLINSDGRTIGHGIDDNLCVEETTLSNKILEKKLYYKGEK